MTRRAAFLAAVITAMLPASALDAQEGMHPAWLSHGSLPIATRTTLLSASSGSLRGDDADDFPFSTALRFDSRTRERETPLGRWSLLTTVARSADRRGESLIAGDLAAVAEHRLSRSIALRTTVGYRGQFRGVDAARADFELRMRPVGRTSLSFGFEHLYGGMLDRQPVAMARAVTAEALAPGTPIDEARHYYGQPGGRVKWSAVRAGLEGRHLGMDWRVSTWWAVDRRLVGDLGSDGASEGLNAELARAITGRLSAVAVLGAGHWGAPSGKLFPSLGLRWRPGADVVADRFGADSSSLAGVFETGTVMRLRVRADGARRVEVLGDVTGWRIKRLSRDAERGWWYVELVPKGGVQRVSIRVDGGQWTAPPGMLVELADYGGTAGVMKVP